MELTTAIIDDFARRMEIGATLKAEIHELKRNASGIYDRTYVTEVTILEKYPFFALTDHGAIQWVNMALHNRDQLRRVL